MPPGFIMVAPQNSQKLHCLALNSSSLNPALSSESSFVESLMPEPSAASAPSATVTVALIGNPNTGKSTLFNALSGCQARVGNFPGVTVEKKVGRCRVEGTEITLVDLPGTYSLSPRSADEMVSVDVLLGRQTAVTTPDAVVCIVDASNLERNLYLFSQIRDLTIPTVLVLNMWDLAQSRGIQIDVDQLAQRLGVKVVTTSAHRRQGVQEVGRAILEVAGTTAAEPPQLFPQIFYDEVQQLADWFRDQGAPCPHFYLLERMLLDIRGASEEATQEELSSRLREYLGEARLRLATGGCRIPATETKVRYQWIREQLEGVVTRAEVSGAATLSDRIDKILTHRFLGIVFFAVLMFVVFQAIYSWSGPFMDWIEGLQGWVGGTIGSWLAPGTLRSLLVDGLVAGVGSVIIFLPQIVMLFAFIAILEDCGYMARAAFLMDKLMTKVGLSGKSFLPLMSSFACAIPGVMATRVIENRRDRMVTILVAPLMSCSARLPVYLLMIYTFIPAGVLLGFLDQRAVVLFSMYSLGAVIAIPIAWLFKKTLFKGETPPFVMELPAYKWPSARIVLDRVYDRGKAFVSRAGTLIFSVTVIVWALSYFPGDHAQQHSLTSRIEEYETQVDELQSEIARLLADSQQSSREVSATGLSESDRAKFQLLNEQIATIESEISPLVQQHDRVSGQLIRESYLGRMGVAVEPVVKPLGWDWRLGVGALASFPAREVIIATLGTIFSLGGDVDEKSPGLKAALAHATWPDGRPLFTIPVALSIMVFFALCAQCGATLMVIRRETNSWRWPVFTFVYMTLLAYLGAFVTYQLGTMLIA